MCRDPFTMTTRAMTTRLLSVFISLLLLLNGGQVMALEEPSYEVLFERDTIEIRRYDPYLVAEFTAASPDAGNQAFRVLAGYIFGDNREQEKMKMTAPVESQGSEFAFVMESAYAMDTLPQPNDDRIKLRERPARTVAVARFSGRWTDANVAKHERRLLDELHNLGIETSGAPILARYNSPFTPWFLRRNEIIVPVVIAAESPASL